METSEQSLKITLVSLEEQLVQAKDRHNKVYQSLPGGMDWNQYQERLQPSAEKVEYLDRQIRKIKPYELSKIPTYGDVMTLTKFIECVVSGGFIDYDGSGNYVKDGQMTDIDIYPSDVYHDCIRNEFDTIIWFNK